MSMFPGNYRSPLLGSEGARAAGAPDGGGAEPSRRPILYTGRQLVAFRSGATQEGLREMSKLAGLAGSEVASTRDFHAGSNLADALQQTEAVHLDRLGVMIVKDASRLASVAAVGGDSPIQEVSPERFVPLASDGGEPAQAMSNEELRRAVADFGRAMHQLLRAAGAGPEALGAPPRDQAASAAPSAFQDTSTMTWGIQAVGADATTLTGRGVKVCVIDSGIDPTHPDFKGRAAGLTLRSFVGDDGVDQVGHGTHVSGSACGRRDSTLAYGVAPDAELFVAKVINPQNGLATDGDILAAINWAVAHGCQVVNMSLAARVNPGDSYSGAFEVAAQNALQAGTLLVAAAGNFSERPGVIAPVAHPANCPSVLAVGAVGPDLSIAPFSCGTVNPDGKVDVAGPGTYIFSSWPMAGIPKPEAGIQQPGRPGFAFDQGTSMASPHVAGVAALLSQKLGGTGGLGLWQALVLGAVRGIGLPARDVGFGLIRAPRS